MANGDEEPRTPWAAAARWLFGQEAMTVLLFIVVLGIGYGAWVGVPALVTSIQAGYKQIDDSHAERQKSERDEFRKSLESQSASQEKQLERISSTFDKTLDRAMRETGKQ